MIGSHRDLYRRLGAMARRPQDSLSRDMQTLIDYLEPLAPLPIWQDVRAIDYDAALRALRAWFSDLLVHEPPQPQINGLWFGIAHPALPGGDYVAELYLGGSTKYDRGQRRAEWACSLDYLPEAPYADCRALHDIYKCLTTADGIEDDLLDAEEPLCLGFATLAVTKLMAPYSSDMIIPGSNLLGIAFGFDEGDLLPLGELHDDGFRLTFRW